MPVRIGRAQALSEDVADARQLDHCAHAARRDNARAFGGGTKYNAAGAEAAHDFVRNRAFMNRHPHQALLRAIDALANRLRNFIGLAQAESDQPVMVAGDYQRAEAEPAPALDDLGNAVDMHDLLFDFEALRIDSLRHRAFP